ncbi:5-formyltetrahydrofolate cyclo-ligase, mitochondrial-like isoform X2 [Nymphaea colorata]|nr:5-formyltetrahydrofolate cyclo-ligase, mitochondrial-like isoform X2 [Nymphaea colorata]XP_031480984.1 5-formyltetrahydrofolate cyclo-ligase, mitochondrial-like isoform X2 [Nymphaea colorata]
MSVAGLSLLAASRLSFPTCYRGCILSLKMNKAMISIKTQPTESGYQQEKVNINADDLFQQKRSIRSKLRRQLRAMNPSLRHEEDCAIQKIVLDSPWFKSSTSLCAYISCASLFEVDTSQIISEVLSSYADQNSHMQKSLYVPRVENKKSFMRMLKITNREDLIENSMNILEPSAIDSSGIERQDVMQAQHPVDLFILPGYAFDRSGRRLGRGGGYYDCFLANYMELASRKGWRQPLLVALAYSIQIVDDPIPVTPTDIHVDAIASPAGVLQISSAAMERM